MLRVHDIAAAILECLRNKLGVRDTEALLEVEFRIVSIRDVEAARETVAASTTWNI